MRGQREPTARARGDERARVARTGEEHGAEQRGDAQGQREDLRVRVQRAPQIALPNAKISAAQAAPATVLPAATPSNSTPLAAAALQTAENAFIRHATVPRASACEKIQPASV